MKFSVSAAAALVALLPTTAAAWDFGRRVRGPDYLDPYLYFFGILTGITFLAVMITKPSSVPMRELYRAQLPKLCKAYHRMFCVVAVPFLAILLVGPGILIYERDFAQRDIAQAEAAPRQSLTRQLSGALSARPSGREDTSVSRMAAGGAKFVSVDNRD